MFRRRQFEVEYTEEDGAHTWIVWREYLREFAPKLFR
jgi:enterochelin esterase-like enzyme